MKTTTLLSCILLMLIVAIGCQEAPPPPKEVQTKPTRFQEPHRPQIHFSPATQWMNDPNGMVFFEGEYHLFFQHYPDSTIWGPMHWGHAISTDLVHWEHLPIAIYPDSLGYIFSGSAVVDWKNTTGFGTEESPAMVAMYTYHDPIAREAKTGTHETQGIAYSTDRGRTWTKYEENPVLQNPGSPDFRDPKLIWDQERSHWLLALAVQDHTAFYSSPDLKSWTHLSDFGHTLGGHGGVWECPDFFPIQVEGTEEMKWVLLLSINPGGPNGGSATQYFVGDFDGTTFTLDPQFEQDVQNNEGVWIDYGKDNYAGVTWSDIPSEDGRRIFIGWMSNWQYANLVPTEVWRNAMTVPRALSLDHTANGYRLSSQPVEEVRTLEMGEPTVINTDDLADSAAIAEWGEDNYGGMRIELEFAANPTGQVGIELSNALGETVQIGFDPADNQFFTDRSGSGDHSFSDAFAEAVQQAPRIVASDQPIIMDIILDVSSMELFADQGATVMTSIHFPTQPFSTIKLIATEGSSLQAATVTNLSSIW